MSGGIQQDLIAVYMNVLREVEGGEADFEELEKVLSHYGIELDVRRLRNL